MNQLIEFINTLNTHELNWKLLTNLPWLESLFIVGVPKNDSLISKGLQKTNLDFCNVYYIIIIEDLLYVYY